MAKWVLSRQKSINWQPFQGEGVQKNGVRVKAVRHLIRKHLFCEIR